MKFLKKIQNSSEIVEQAFNVLYFDESSKTVQIKTKPQPIITITLSGNLTDTSTVGLNATKTVSVEGDIVWSHNLATDVAHIENNFLVFDKHYDGEVTITATANNAVASTSVTITCDEVATATTYSVSNISRPSVSWSTTSATITFDGTRTDYYEKKDPVTTTSQQSQVVEFTQNNEATPVDYTTSLEFVDLGLPNGTLWAKCNVGAQSETEYGLYFSWGDTVGYKTAGDVMSATTKDGSFVWEGETVEWIVDQGQKGHEFNWENEKWNGGSSSYDSTYFASVSGQVMNSSKVLLAENDAAHVRMGSNWRMPTTADTVELYNNTTSTWYASGNTEFNGVAGRKFASKTDSSKYIFVPAAGGCSNSSLGDVGSSGNVWSSSLGSSYPYYAYNLYFYSSNVNPQGSSGRYGGRSVRGVVSAVSK